MQRETKSYSTHCAYQLKNPFAEMDLSPPRRTLFRWRRFRRICGGGSESLLVIKKTPEISASINGDFSRFRRPVFGRWVIMRRLSRPVTIVSDITWLRKKIGMPEILARNTGLALTIRN